MFGDIDDTFMGGLRYNNSNNTLFFYTNNVATWRIDSNGNLLNNDDTRKLQLGASQDLEIYHDGSHSRITNSTGALSIQTDIVNFANTANDENLALFTANGSSRTLL